MSECETNQTIAFVPSVKPKKRSPQSAPPSSSADPRSPTRGQEGANVKVSH